MANPVELTAPTSRLRDHGLPVYTMQYEEYFKASAIHLQTLFRNYPVIVIKDRPTRLKSDLSSLEEWGDPDELRDMHGALIVCLQISLLLIPVFQTTLGMIRKIHQQSLLLLAIASFFQAINV